MFHASEGCSSVALLLLFLLFCLCVPLPIRCSCLDKVDMDGGPSSRVWITQLELSLSGPGFEVACWVVCGSYRSPLTVLSTSCRPFSLCLASLRHTRCAHEKNASTFKSANQSPSFAPTPTRSTRPVPPTTSTHLPSRPRHHHPLR